MQRSERNGRGRRAAAPVVHQLSDAASSSTVGVVHGTGLMATRFLARNDIILAPGYEAVPTLPPSLDTPAGAWSYVAATTATTTRFYDLSVASVDGVSLYHINDARPRGRANVRWGLWWRSSCHGVCLPTLSLTIVRPIETGHELLVAYDASIEGADTTDEDEEEGDEETA